MRLLSKKISQTIWLLLLVNIGWAQSETRTVCGGLTVPWDIEYLPDNQLIFTEINGRIGKVNLATGEVKTLLQMPEVARELQAGLLGLALHPDFLRSKKIFVAYTSYKGDALVLRIAELTLDLDRDTLSFSKIIFDNIPAGPTDIGGRLLATKDAHGLYAQHGFTPLPEPSRWMVKMASEWFRPIPPGTNT